MRIFLGGTCNGSLWRDELIPHLSISYFNPVVPSWTEEAYENELRERETCDIILYVITPLAKGFYSIAEVADDSNKRPEKTVMCILPEDNGISFEPFQLKSLRKVGQMVRENGAFACEGLDALKEYLAERAAVRIPTAMS